MNANNNFLERQFRSMNIIHSNYLKLLPLALLMQIPAVSLAEGQVHPDSTKTGRYGAGWRTTLTTGYVGQGKSDLQNNGDFSVDSGFLKIESARRVGQKWFAGISLGYTEDHYSFSGSGLKPLWGDIRSLQFGVSMRYLASDKWTLFGLPILRYTSEKGADLDDGRELGLLAGASYRFSNKLTLGPGLGYFNGIGGEDDVFPILLVNWKITDSLSLETGRGTAASRGPGLALKWKPYTQWEFGIAARYEKTRFRLADQLDRIGEDKSVPVVLTAEWKYKDHLTLTALAGMKTSGSLSVEDSKGNRINKSSYDTAPLAGLVATFKF